ncbi:hypothetical protein HZA39_00450 [Candidatus Peregrinibacteria bacterium]|nr:hypothetical protein [Candidatus Peregrinibacteria bacterium]
MSGGNLKLFIEGVKTVDTLRDKDSVLIVEACNHDRKCDDIGTVQIPRLIRKKTGKKLCFKFNFGRVFPDNLSPYRLIVHCGACMIDRQKYLRRIFMAEKTGTPITNYGILLSYLRGKKVLKKAVKPFGTGSL